MSAVVQKIEKTNMIRKPVMMPPDLIKKINRIAEERKEPFAAIMREAAYAYDPSSLNSDDEAMIISMLDLMVKSNLETIRKIDELEKRLDDTHEILSKVP